MENKLNSLRFGKYSTLENHYNKNNELILWEYNNSSIFTINRKIQFQANILYGQANK